jgi:uncharacterized protein (DUF58 family)
MPASHRQPLSAALDRLARGWRVASGLFPITTLGVLVAAVGAWAHFSLAPDAADFVLYATGVTALSLVGLSLASVLLGALVLAVALRRRPAGVPETLTTGVEVETGFSLPALTAWPLLLVRWSWVSPDGAEVRTERGASRLLEFLRPRERGQADAVIRRFELRDIFGLSAIAFDRRWAAPVRIVPVRGRANLELAMRRASEDGYSHPSGQPLGELVEMRRYRAGDPVRHIVWKAFARSRRLMVREPERAIAPRPAMVAFFVAGEQDEPSASTARLFLEAGLLGADFRFMASGGTAATDDAALGLEQIIASRAHRAAGADGLAGLLRTVDRGRLDNLVLFGPAGDGGWVDRVLEQMRTLSRPPLVILTVDGDLSAPPGRSLGATLRRGLFRRDDAREAALLAVTRAHDRLRRAGAEVRLVHRGTGARLDAMTLEGWRAAA